MKTVFKSERIPLSILGDRLTEMAEFDWQFEQIVKLYSSEKQAESALVLFSSYR
jgi:hypothetical protein